MKEQIIQQGAEAVLIKKGNALLKRRTAKGYRLKVLDDKLRGMRTRKEAKLIEKAGKLINVPGMIKVNDKEMEIEMDFVEGKKLSESLDGMKNWEEVCLEIGRSIGKLHDAGIIHGDLTTSNLIWSSDVGDEKKGKLYFIDFGLGFENGKTEDKAVDLHLIKQALEAKHFLHFDKFFKAVLKGYESSKGYKEVMKRFEKVEKRGRYKNNY